MRRFAGRPGLVALGLTVAVAALRPGLATATVPADLCTGNPCNVTAAITVDSGSVLDFGAGTDLRLKATAILTIGPEASGSRPITLRAGSIVMEPGSRILGNGDGAAVTLDAETGVIDIQASGSTISRIVVSGNSAGSVDLTAPGNITVSGTIDASGFDNDGIGGSVTITSGGAFALNREIEIGGAGSFTSGGDISVSAQTGIAVNGIIDGGAAGDGASVDLFTVTGDIIVTKKIDVSGGSPEGLGGAIDLAAIAGNVSITAPIVGNGGTGVEESCGDGAELNITSGLAALLGTGAMVTINAGTQCFGGAVSVVAGTSFTQQTGADIVAQGPGSFGGGGSLTVQTGTDITLRNIDFVSPGSGGFMDIRSAGGPVSFLGVVDSRGTGSFGIGGFTDVVGCNVTVASGAKIDTRGNFAIPGTGVNFLRAGGTLTVAGQLLASSKNQLEVRTGAPVITGTVNPAPTVVTNPNLPDCAQMAACGDGNVDAGEVCDDDNNANCDGCHADCLSFDDVCGDGITECGEQCDDSNTEDGDGCNADCTLPGSEGVRFAGATLPTTGCFGQWELKIVDPVINVITGFPKIDQSCVDGDSTCDTDGINNQSCSFEARICLRVPDPRLPSCTAGPIEYVTIKNPDSFTQGTQADRGNSMRLATALEALGGEVRMGGNVLQTGPVLTAFDNCTAPITLVVPHGASTGKELFNFLVHDNNNKTMSSNQMRLACEPNNAVCGNGIPEPTEFCDDGNTNNCDGCSSTCRVESCGDGVVQCNEQCDDGSANGTPSSRCSATCQELPPALRIPGGGAKALDCGLEFSAELNPAEVKVDFRGIPKTQQVCRDNDPACDLDPAVGSCRVRLWTCAGAADARVGCVAAAVNQAEVVAPNARATGGALAARQALAQALQNLPNPAGPGEVCSSRFDVDIPLGQKGLTIKPRVRFVLTNKPDMDTLKVRCLAPLAP